MENYEKTGYLQNDFRIFHLNDMKKNGIFLSLPRF